MPPPQSSPPSGPTPGRLAVLALLGLAAVAGAFLLLRSSPESSAQAEPGASPSATRRAGGVASRPLGGHAPDDEEAPTLAPGSTDVANDGAVVVEVSSGGKPVAGAEVRLYWRARGQGGGGGGRGGRGGGRGRVTAESWSHAGEGRTSADGTLRLPVKPGRYLVAARSGALAPGRVEASHPSGGAETKVSVELVPGITLKGHTEDWRTHAPVALAEIVLSPVLRAGPRQRTELPSEETATATSDTRGNFEIAGLAPGAWSLSAQAPSYATTRLPGLVLPHADLTVSLMGASTIEGTVLREGKPAAGAVVTVTGQGEPVTVEAGAQGGYSASVEPGRHHVTASLGELTGAAGAPVLVAAGATAKGVDIELGPGASIVGKVRSSAGPVAGATVEASPSRERGKSARTVSGEDGSFELRGLAPGAYDVEATAKGHGRNASRGVTLRAGDRFPVDLLLPGLTAVEGTVTVEGGGPARGATVWVSGGGPGRFGREPTGEAVTDAQGHYRIEGAPEGRALLQAQRDPRSPIASQPLSLAEDQVAHADLELLEGGLVTGTVLDAKQNPVPGATVLALDPAGGFGPGSFHLAVADASGAFLLPLPVGSYNLSAMRPDAMPGGGGGPGGGRRGMGPGGRPPVLGTATAAVGHPVEVTLVLPEEPQTAGTGHVLEPGGAPSVGATVRITGGAAPQTVSTDADGAFAFTTSPDVALEVDGRNGGRTGTATVVAAASDVTVQLQPSAKIQGHLVGDPPPDSYSVTTRTRGAPMPWMGGGDPNDLQFSAPTFELDDVAPGQVSVSVKTSDGRVGQATATTTAGQASQVEVQLSPSAKVTGRVIDATTNKPVLRARAMFDSTPGLGAMTDPDGHFSRTLAVGQHQLQVMAQGYQPATRTVDLKQDPATTDLGDIALQPTGPQPGTIGASFTGTGTVLVANVLPSGPAAQAGLLPGDVVESVDGQAPASAADADARSKGAPGSPVALGLRRAGSPVAVTVSRAP